MDITNKKHCALCNILLNVVQYNLKVHNSNYSNRPLMIILENVIGKFPILHYDICLQCYDLLNELDALELRQTEIQNQFKKYLKDLSRCISTTEDPPQNINSMMNEINDSNLLTSNETADMPKLNDSLDIKLENPNEVDIKLEQYNEIKEENKQIVNATPASKASGKTQKNTNVLKPHKCHCSKEFRTAGELKNHKTSHSEGRAFVCEICGQSYKHKSAFNIHMDMHKGINLFVCVYCKKSFTQKGALVRHGRIHTGEKPYQCDECGKQFTHHTSFSIHRLSHSGAKSYKCDLCGLALMSVSHLKRHKRIHTGEKKFACSTCGKRFAERYNLAVHEKLHTNSCSSGPQKRNYSCQICGVSFMRKVKLDEHLVKEHQILKSDLIKKEDLKPSIVANKDSCISIISNG